MPKLYVPTYCFIFIFEQVNSQITKDSKTVAILLVG